MKKITLIFSLAVATSTLLSSPLIASTVAWWKFENNYFPSEGTRISFKDNGSGFSQDSAPYSDSSCSALFNGTSLHFESPITLPQNYTVEFFIKADSLNNCTVFNAFLINARPISLTIQNGAFSIDTIVSDLITAGVWYHVAVVKHNSRPQFFALYVDYNYIGSLDLYNYQTFDASFIGSSFFGKIDELRISDEVLTTEDFLQKESTVIPEPCSLLLLLVGIIGLLRRKKV